LNWITTALCHIPQMDRGPFLSHSPNWIATDFCHLLQLDHDRFLLHSLVESRPLSATFPIGLRDVSVPFPSWIMAAVTFPNWTTDVFCHIPELDRSLFLSPSRVGSQPVSVTFQSWIAACLSHSRVGSQPVSITFQGWIAARFCHIPELDRSLFHVPELDRSLFLSHSRDGSQPVSVTFSYSFASHPTIRH
jgi:hypothetical protein